MKGLMFNNQYGMWEAVLMGLKTNTRRTSKALEPINKDPDNWRLSYASAELFRFQSKSANRKIEIEPRYRVGDTCYLQEPVLDATDTFTNKELVLYRYKDHQGHSDTDAYEELLHAALRAGAKWQNKMFMPSQHARYYIQITGVKIERLQSISHEDCIAEGIYSRIQPTTKRLYRVYEKNQDYKKGLNFTHDSKKSYASLLAVVQGDTESWDKNEWCFSYYFKLLSKSEVEQLKNSAHEHQTQR